MAALPTTGITTSAVAAAIGEGSNDVGTLFLSGKVNPWGFNCPDLALQNAIWGKTAAERANLSPNDPDYVAITGVKPGYHLGAFRGYDHQWVVYGAPAISDNFTGYENPLNFRIYLEKRGYLLIDPSPGIVHHFKTEFSRNGISWVTINSDFSVIYPYSAFGFGSDNPPDYATNGILDEGETFYIRITHLSSPDRRWFDTVGISLQNQFTTPASLYTNLYELENVHASAVLDLPDVNSIHIYADFYADFSENQYFDFLAQISTVSDFSQNVTEVEINDVLAPKNEDNPGTLTFVQSLNFSSTINPQISDVGDTLYYRIYANGNLRAQGSVVIVEPGIA